MSGEKPQGRTIPAARAGAALGCILGTAVGDALGLPCEGLTPRRQRRLFPRLDRYFFLFRRGMVSDDTEHTCLTAQALVASGGQPERFARDLARRLRWWLLGVPAGVGLATLRSIMKLWLGFPPQRSGVFSAGNGPAIRAAITGVCFGHDRERMRALVRAASRLTHSDPKSDARALAVALAASLAGCRGEEVEPQEYLNELRCALGGSGEELLGLVAQVGDSLAARESTEGFAHRLGLSHGVTGYIFHTVPVALHCWLRNQKDFSAGVREAVRCGGDTDTVAAIAGALIGAGVGKRGIPEHWIDSLAEWPRTVRWMEGLAACAAEVSNTGLPGNPPAVPALAVLARNLFFLVVVVLHGLRRLLPPY